MSCSPSRCEDLQVLKELVRIKVACLVGIASRLDLEVPEEKRKFYIKVIKSISEELEETLLVFENRTLLAQQKQLVDTQSVY